jgi:hypothetical protein
VFGIDSDYLKDSEDMTIFGTSESDAALLAVSILLLGDLSDGQFSQRLMEFSQAIRMSGKWDNEDEKSKMVYWILMTVSPSFCFDRVGDCYTAPTTGCSYGTLVASCYYMGQQIKTPSEGGKPASLSSIKNNILSWNLSSDVPNFEKYMSDFFATKTNLGACDSEMQGNVKEYGYYGFVICKDGNWQTAKRDEVLSFELGDCSAANENEIKFSELYNYQYICKGSLWQQ